MSNAKYRDANGEDGEQEHNFRTETVQERSMQYYQSIFTSDIKIEDLDCQLRVWIVQLIENAAYEHNAKSIEVRFLHKGAEGFDVIDDGDGLK